MYVELVKLAENETFVSYRFESDIPDGTYINKHEKLSGLSKVAYGYCTFNKITEEFELDSQKSHSYFINNKRETFYTHVKLIRTKRESSSYPAVIVIATG